MDNKCLICSAKAKFKISSTNDYYCEDCAVEFFGDISCLLKVDTESKKIKQIIDDKTSLNVKNENNEEFEYIY